MTTGKGAPGTEAADRGRLTFASLSSLLPLSPSTPIVSAPTSGKSKSKNSGGQVKASPRAVAAARGGDCRPISKRQGGGGEGTMNPHGILTGLGTQRGVVVRRMVYDGALRVEDCAHAIVRDALTNYLLRNAAMATAAGGGGRNAETAMMAMRVFLQRGFF
jgi:hypothetical protein